MPSIKVIDNFLPHYQFKHLNSVIMGDEFPWYYNDQIVAKIPGKKYTGTGKFGNKTDATATIILFTVAKDQTCIRGNINIKNQNHDMGHMLESLLCNYWDAGMDLVSRKHPLACATRNY